MPLPGEVWSINALEGHCLLVALERHRGSFEIGPGSSIDLVLQGCEAANRTSLTPTDGDRWLFEQLIGRESPYLACFEPFDLLPCGHYAGTHEEALQAWGKREIELPKHFASSRDALAQLPLEERLSGETRLTRKDAEKEIERELERLRESLEADDPKILRELVEIAAPGVVVGKQTVEALKRGHRATLEDARRQLWALLEKRIID